MTRFDAVVSDMRMPRMNGAELYPLAAPRSGLPANIVSAHTCDEDLVRVRHSGLLALLSKPAPIDRLLALLACARRDSLVVLVDDKSARSDGDRLSASETHERVAELVEIEHSANVVVRDGVLGHRSVLRLGRLCTRDRPPAVVTRKRPCIPS